MITRPAPGALISACLLTAFLFTGCTGGQESSAAETRPPAPKKVPVTDANPPAQPDVDVEKELKTINAAIPLYAGARYRQDLTHRDSVMIRQQFGPTAQVYTMGTDDSFPQVWHYYTTYMAQFRGFQPQAPYPPGSQSWRTMEIQLNQAMQDPFIPGDTFKQGDRQVVLQIAETEAEPRTVIRYIITPQAVAQSVALQ